MSTKSNKKHKIENKKSASDKGKQLKNSYRKICTISEEDEEEEYDSMNNTNSSLKYSDIQKFGYYSSRPSQFELKNEMQFEISAKNNEKDNSNFKQKEYLNFLDKTRFASVKEIPTLKDTPSKNTKGSSNDSINKEIINKISPLKMLNDINSNLDQLNQNLNKSVKSFREIPMYDSKKFHDNCQSNSVNFPKRNSNCNLPYSTREEFESNPYLSQKINSARNLYINKNLKNSCTQTSLYDEHIKSNKKNIQTFYEFNINRETSESPFNRRVFN